MKRMATILAVLVLGGSAGLLTAADRSAPPPERRFTDKYALIVQRNIFSRTRSQPTTRPGSGSERVLSRSEQPYVLTGIVQRDDGDGYYAFIEDTRSSSTAKYRVGDAVGPSRIAAMSLNTIDVEAGSKRLTIEIGMGLDGGAPQTPLVSSTTRPTSGPSSDILERLRQRRLRELGR